jgi:hypothetical protein
MSKDEALKMAMYELEIVGLKDGDTYNVCKEALEQPAQEHNFCSRCGKRASKDLNQIHTCTPPNN